MKKIVSMFLASIMVLSMLTAFIVPTVAVSDEGGWDVMLSATTDLDDIKRQPIPGYYYDETGFHTDAPNYKNYNPKFSVVSKETYDIRNFSMTIVVHDYSAKGDNWLSLSVWSESNGFAQGNITGKYGDGWTSLIRAGADGNVNRLESWDQTIGGRSGKQTFINIDGTQMNPIVFEPIVDAKTGDFTITFEIKNGVVSVNGSVIGENTDACIADRFKDGFAYVGVTLHNTDSSGDYRPTVSIVDVNGMTPEGSDYRYPEDRILDKAPFIPSESVPENQPAIWFDGTFATTYNKLVTSMNCDIEIADDNESIKVTACASSFFMQFEVPDHISYEAADFPYILMIFKNFCTCYAEEGENLNYACTGAEVGSIWYCAGEVTSPRNDCGAPIDRWYNVTPVDEKYDYVTDDMYTVVVLPINNELWQGRIHSIRMDVAFYNNFSDDSRNSFEIMGFGVFRSVEEISNFIQNFRGIGLDASWFPPYPVTPCDHFDWDEDGLCDMCFEDMYPIPEEPETEAPIDTEYSNNCDHFDWDRDGLCDMCYEDMSYIEDPEVTIPPETAAPSTDSVDAIVTEKVTIVPYPEVTSFEDTDCCDYDYDGYCDDCGRKFKYPYETNVCDHYRVNSDSHCELCGVYIWEYETAKDCPHSRIDSLGYCRQCGEYFGVEDETSWIEEESSRTEERTTIWNPSYDTNFEDGSVVGTARPEETTAPEETTYIPEETTREEYTSATEELPTRECPHLNVNCDDVCDLCGIPMEPHFDWLGDGICDFCGINIFTNEYPEYTSYETPPNSEFEEVTHPEETYVEVIVPDTSVTVDFTIPGGPFFDVETLEPDATVENEESSYEEEITEKSTETERVIVEVTDETTGEAIEENTSKPSKKDDDDDDDDNEIILLSGCGLSASLGVVAIVSIIGAAALIKKKED